MLFKLILLICYQVLAQENPSYNLEEAHIHFQVFKSKYNKGYDTENENNMRFEIFKQKLRKINDFNADVEPPFAFYDINLFSDLTKEEIRVKTGYIQKDTRTNIQNICDTISEADVTSREAPEELDWRAKNAVTSVKKQGDCGACWAFSAAGVVEGAYAIKHQELVDLSVQQVLDCDEFGTCSGGVPEMALSKLIELGGEMSEVSYPYIEKQGVCRFNKSSVVARVTGCSVYKLSDEDTLKEVLAKTGPLSVAIDFEPVQDYRRGILKECPYNSLNHAVVLVGYGTEKGVPYWILKNTFGPNFGESGYFRLKRGINACGILKSVSSASVQ